MHSSSSEPCRLSSGVTRAWYVVCPSWELKRQPLSRTLLGTPLVLFRGPDGKAAALLDRCAHRNVPLSLGRIVEQRLECCYHGWQYGPDGRCLRIPSLCGPADKEVRSVPRFAALEQDGFVWVYATADVEPSERPFVLPSLVNALCTPVAEFLTRIHAVISFRTRLPRWLVKLLLNPLALRIFKQDAFILKAQGQALRHRGVHPSPVASLRQARRAGTRPRRRTGPGTRARREGWRG